MRAIYGWLVVVGPLATVPPGDRFLSPNPDGQGSYEQGSRSTFVYRMEFFSLNVLLIWVPGHNSVPGNVTMFSFTITMVCYSI